MTRPFLSVREVADMFGKSDETIRGWCKTGLLPNAVQPTDGAHWIIPAASVDQFGKPADTPFPARTARARTAKRSTR